MVAVTEFGATDIASASTNLDQEYDLWPSQLERLIPGDEGYEPPAVPMIEHRKTIPMAPIDTPDTVEAQNNYDDEF